MITVVNMNSFKSPRIKMPDLEPSAVTLLNSPLLSVKTLLKLLFHLLSAAFSFISTHILLLGLLSGSALSIILLEGPHSEVTPTQYMQQAKELFLFTSWWLFLGVASSIGLGTGLHTFVLYLGPHIAKVTLVAYECNYIPKMYPSRWSFETFEDCPEPGQGELSFWTIVLAVQLESFLWGLGTALGELPPYFIARAARSAAKQPEELAELEHLNTNTVMGRLKGFMMRSLKRHGFVTVLLFASIPNPLFDLAGLLCGHFGISLWVFLGAATIGKAFVKVHIQMVFTIIVMGKHKIDVLLSFIESQVPSLHGALSNMLEQHKKLLHNPSLHSVEKSLLGVIWQVVLITMIGFFVYSFLNSLVRNELQKAKKA